MPGLNENHKRRILSTSQYTDKLLEDSLTASRPTARPLFHRLAQEISPAQLHWIESYAEKIREQMGRLLERFQTHAEEKPTPASWALRTNLVYLDISLEDLHPKRMRGYDEVDPDAARDLSWTLNEIRRLVSQLSAFLAESRGTRIARPASSMEARFQKAIEPLLQDSRVSVSASIERKVESLRRALLASLELTEGRVAAGHGMPQDVEQALRPLDDGLEELKRKWRSALDDLSPWAEEILEEAATRMVGIAENAGGTSPSGSDYPLAQAALHTVASRCHTFVREYGEFEETIRSQLRSLQGNGSGSLALDSCELPKAAALPQPMVDRLQGVAIPQLGPVGHLIRGSRLRHFRKELRNKAGDQIEKVLREFHPRLRHWLASMLKDLEESYRLQTDSLRYTSASSGSGQAAESLQEDIRFLRELR